MWKKDEDTTQGTNPKTTDSRGGSGSTPRASTGLARTATIGSSITIHGEVTGDEDLLIQGQVDGSVELKEHAVTIGGDGQVTASIHARVVTVEGRVDGDIEAQEQVILRSSSRVEGDITAPRVVLEDGARFRGGVDMGDPTKVASREETSSSASRSTKSATESDNKSTSSSSPGSTSSGGSKSSSGSTKSKGSDGSSRSTSGTASAAAGS